MALKQVKNKIIATKKTGQVTKAMEAVSAVKMRKSQERAFASRPYVKSALRILARISNSSEAMDHSWFKKRSGSKKLLIVVTSDKGLAGAVNSAVLKRVDEIVAESGDVAVVSIGRKAVEYASRSGLASHGEYVNVSDAVTLADVEAIASSVLEQFDTTDVSSVEIVYQNFLSTFEQLPTNRVILPLDPEEVHRMYRGIRIKGAATNVEEGVNDEVVDYVVEPNAEEVREALVPQLVKIMIYHALLESKASEHSARMVAMKNATDKSKELVKSLTIRYNKERQAAITAEVSEITAGVEAMSN